MSQFFIDMKYFIKVCILTTLIFVIFQTGSAQVRIQFDTKVEPVFHGVKTIRSTFAKLEIPISFVSYDGDNSNSDILVVSDGQRYRELATRISELKPAQVKEEGFQVINDKGRVIIASKDGIGAMYGLIELDEHLQLKGSLEKFESSINNPHFEYRIIKFNLPWYPYRDSPATRLHLQTCKDLKFWEEFLDMMAVNRFNVLSLWNLHPFTYMIRAENFPEATPFDDSELQEWKRFWKALFKMAADRGIQTFIVNWNIVVSPEFAEAYGAEQYNDRSDLVKRYTRESVTQVINEYENLTGIGVTLADWMNNFEGSMSAREREDWIEDTFVAGMKDADRPVKFLHRSVLSGSPIEMRRVINNAGLKEPALVEVKFNWSHGHSMPHLSITHDYHSGEIDERFWEPMPENYRIQWMVRNEDFFILRWGQPDFIRKHIAVNDKPYVNGYFIGSEGYIPALDYSHRIRPEKTWQYGFEKQWLFYKVWGRLLYDPDTPDQFFADSFNRRYYPEYGEVLLKAYSLVSKMPLRLASFYRSTWDYTLYSEGFLAPRRSSPDTYYDGSSDFISIDELIFHETLDPDLIPIVEFVKSKVEGNEIPRDKTSPFELAEELEKDSREALNITKRIGDDPAIRKTVLISELEDIRTWAYLGLYFSEKLKGGVALQTFRLTGEESKKDEAVGFLQAAAGHWQNVVDHTIDRYRPVPHVSIPENSEEYTAFSWKYFLPEVKRDIEIARSATFEKDKNNK